MNQTEQNKNSQPKERYGIKDQNGDWLCGNPRIGRYFSGRSENLNADVVTYSDFAKAVIESKNYVGTTVISYK